MVLLQHLAEGANLVAVAVLLSKLAHLHFGEIALDRLFEKFLAGFVLGKAGRTDEERGGDAGHQPPDRHDVILRFSCWSSQPSGRCDGVIPPPRQGLSSSVGPADVRPDKPGVVRKVPTPALEAK
jgi:hypothetical protein